MQAKRNALTCEYDNDVFDCNEQAQNNMTSLMGFANLGMNGEYWGYKNALYECKSKEEIDRIEWN